jgi:hypothetical protein
VLVFFVALETVVGFVPAVSYRVNPERRVETLGPWCILLYYGEYFRMAIL